MLGRETQTEDGMHTYTKKTKFYCVHHDDDDDNNDDDNELLIKMNRNTMSVLYGV